MTTPTIRCATGATQSRITCINGSFTKADRAAIPVADRGFRFGDGVFATLRVEAGVPYQWELHLANLLAGLQAVGIVGPAIDWQQMAARTLARNKAESGFLRIAVSRGVGSRGYLPFPPNMPATYVIEYLPPLPAPTVPAKLWLSEWAKIPPACLPGKFKLAQGMNSTLALREAEAQACDEALQLTTEGFLSEAASANLFWIEDDTIFTPSLETGCLNGTTRDAVLRLSPTQTRTVTAGLSRLENAQAVFITNTRLGVHAVSELKPMGWKFDSEHKLIKQLAKTLTWDRLEYAKAHPEWANA